MTVEIATRMLEASPATAEIAARRLDQGGLVAFPTETVYGLGSDATNGEAVARLYAAKGRPSFNPLIAHVASAGLARRLAVFDETAELLARRFWPGPLTLVLPKREGCSVSDLATAGLDTIAIRVPSHPFARDLLLEFGGPVVAPSANRSGHVSPTRAEHVMADLEGRVDLVVDGGAAGIGLESTIVACLGEATLLRPGGLSGEDLAAALGAPLRASPHRADAPEGGPLAPGMLASHYAPKARLRLDADDLRAGEALLAFGMRLIPGSGGAHRICNLSKAGDLIEAAANLFSHLRLLDASGATMIAVMPIPHQGLGEAINDRLARAAAPRT